MKIIQVRECQECKKYLETHATLEVKNVMEQKKLKNGNWAHTTWQGRMLHKKVK